MRSILGTAKELLAPALHPGGTAADFTMGNGHDTLSQPSPFPAEKSGPLISQPAALEATRALLAENGAGDNDAADFG